MCYAIPGKVIEINGRNVVVDYFGEKRKALNDFVKIKVGDYIYAQGGFVINTVPEAEALKTLDAWKDLFFELKQIDLRISERRFAEQGFPKNFIDLLNRAVGSDAAIKPAATTPVSPSSASGNAAPAAIAPAARAQTNEPNLSRTDLQYILNTKDSKELDAIYRAANFVRQKHLDNACCVHGIIEFSNYCQQNCFYCGIRAENKALPRYRMTTEEIVDAMEVAVNKYGFRAMILQSGEDLAYTDDQLVDIVKKIREECAVLLFVSFGERKPKTYARLFEAGARGVLMRFETSNAALYEKLRPGKKLADRLALIKHCFNLGYLVLTGGIIGLPGQTTKDLLNDIDLTKELHAEMYTFGPLIPHHSTPLKNTPYQDLDLSLKVIAAARFNDPHAKIVVTTALETLDPKNGRQRGLLAGANSLMINCTPKKYQQLYEIYPDKAGTQDSLKKKIEDTLAILKSLGRAPTDLGTA